jgi:hypothetical protein
MNIELSSAALKLINDLYRTGLYGSSPEEVARRLIEEKLTQLLCEGILK